MYAKVFIHAVGSYYCNQDKEAINLAYDGDENSFYDDSVENADCGQLYNISASYASDVQKGNEYAFNGREYIISGDTSFIFQISDDYVKDPADFDFKLRGQDLENYDTAMDAINYGDLKDVEEFLDGIRYFKTKEEAEKY